MSSSAGCIFIGGWVGRRGGEPTSATADLENNDKAGLLPASRDQTGNVYGVSHSQAKLQISL